MPQKGIHAAQLGQLFCGEGGRSGGCQDLDQLARIEDAGVGEGQQDLSRARVFVCLFV